MSIIDPATRKEMYLDVIRRLALGESVDVSDLIEPGDREERFLYDICKNYSGGGSSVEVEPLDVTENGVYDEGEGKAYSPVNVEVPNSYDAGDVGKVVKEGLETGVYELAEQTAYPATITENGDYDTTLYDSVTVAVSGGTPVSSTVSGTLAAPFGTDAVLATLVAANIMNFWKRGYRAYISIDGSALGMGTTTLPISSMSSTGSGVEMQCRALDASSTTLADATGASYTVTQTSSGATVNAALMLSGGQLVDISQYAAALPTVITYFGDGT